MIKVCFMNLHLPLPVPYFSISKFRLICFETKRKEEKRREKKREKEREKEIQDEEEKTSTFLSKAWFIEFRREMDGRGG